MQCTYFYPHMHHQLLADQPNRPPWCYIEYDAGNIRRGSPTKEWIDVRMDARLIGVVAHEELNNKQFTS